MADDVIHDLRFYAMVYERVELKNKSTLNSTPKNEKGLEKIP